ncbi:N-acyl-D-amino-acid deacylase [Haladaptatus litoreus]|uniref:N-acyl-D-amino-acid deacylase n=1 Tax=Haladaptatus litoreus TaxID=553468 RepID=A0A1N7EM00_9EURY|nr:D-aminoacylase [Haladaptatus litoreus]SIR89098.1 N-acyl-D-amino-acid deacylase [Haladaptatus litoreus]
MTFDLLVKDTRIIDGTGAPWFRGSVAVTDGTIDQIFRTPSPQVSAKTTLDGSGLVTCPGFVDTHTHSDLELFSDPTLAPKLRQGITTEILGQDGFSMAPLYRDEVDAWETHLSGINGRLDDEWGWESLTDYLDAIGKQELAPNVATLVGHGTVRFNVLGFSDTDPTAGDLEQMVEHITEALDDGAIGLSTGLVYPPARYADTAEVKRLASALHDYGRPFVAHIRNEREQIWSALDEFIDIGAEVGIPLHLSHFKLAGPPQQGKVDRALAIIETARERGVDLTVEQYPYTAGSTTLTNVLPPWVQANGPEQTLRYLRDDESRDQIRRDIEEWRIGGWENRGAYTGWENIEVTSVQSSANKSVEGKSIATIAAERDTDPVSVVCDLLVDEELEVSMLLHQLTETDVREILTNERVNVGTDGLFGGRPHPRVYGTYPKILGQYIREENLLTLEEGIRKMTSLPARAMGLDSKGVLRPGLDADIVLFDPRTVGTDASYEHPRQFPTGIPHVIVNGELVVQDNEFTEARPGQVIRK